MNEENNGKMIRKDIANLRSQNPSVDYRCAADLDIIRNNYMIFSEREKNLLIKVIVEVRRSSTGGEEYGAIKDHIPKNRGKDSCLEKVKRILSGKLTPTEELLFAKHEPKTTKRLN